MLARGWESISRAFFVRPLHALWKVAVMKKVVLAMLLAAGVATPALADPPSWSPTPIRAEREWRDRDDRGNRGNQSDRGEWRNREQRGTWRNNDRRGDERGGWDRRADQRRDWENRNRNNREWNNRDWRRDNRDWRRDNRDWRRDNHDWRRDNRYSNRWDRNDWRGWRNYDYNRPDPRYGRYYADRYYRDGRYYSNRSLGWNDRIYRGYDGRYYCRRSDGTTGLLLGAIAGGLLGDAMAPGDSRTVGALIGGSLGALLGREIDRDDVRCR